MTIVVDASVAIKWFIPEAFHEQAQGLLLRYEGGIEAPDLLVAEIASIAWKKLRRGEIAPSQGSDIPIETCSFIAAFHLSGDLVKRAAELAFELDRPVYDCLYVACAMKVDAPLITADERLFRVLTEKDSQSIARFLGEEPALHQLGGQNDGQS